MRISDWSSDVCSSDLLAVRHHVALVPFGGGTSVTGGLVARREGFAGVLSLDLVRMKALREVDTVSMTAVLAPGLRGPEAEAHLAEHGLMLGHYPLSFQFASILLGNASCRERRCTSVLILGVPVT